MRNPKNRLTELIEDKANDSRAFRNWLRSRGIKILSSLLSSIENDARQ
jgi:hypothetical protein